MPRITLDACIYAAKAGKKPAPEHVREAEKMAVRYQVSVWFEDGRWYGRCANTVRHLGLSWSEAERRITNSGDAGVVARRRRQIVPGAARAEALGSLGSENLPAAS
ncbi:MAG: hypothetical protein ABSH20_27695, partial [Tepidisphaeraceae bacterium]